MSYTVKRGDMYDSEILINDIFYNSVSLENISSLERRSEMLNNPH